jgi:hypothetical protein
VPTSEGEEPELPVNELDETTTPVMRMRTKRGAMRMRLQALKRARLSGAGTRQDGTRNMGGRNLMDACKKHLTQIKLDDLCKMKNGKAN